MGDPQISSANRKSANLRTYKIWHICGSSEGVAICGFAICGPSTFLLFAYLIIFADLKLPQICKLCIFLLINLYLKCSNLNFYSIKNLAKQTCSRLLRSLFRLFSDLWWKICGLAICGVGHLRNLRICIWQINQKKFAELKFADSRTSEICGFAITDWAQKFADLRFADLTKHLRAHLCINVLAFLSQKYVHCVSLWKNLQPDF